MRVLLPLPDRDFDPTEVAVPWHVLTEAGNEVVFATEHGGHGGVGGRGGVGGHIPECDPRLLEGALFGRLGAAAEPITLYQRMRDSRELGSALRWRDLDMADFDGLVLPGGHAPGMRQYLDAAELRDKVAAYWSLGRPVGAICHGVLVLARTFDPSSRRSVIHASRTTCLPKYMERGAYLMTAWKLGRYYRTYQTYVEDEVRAALDNPSLLVRGPLTPSRRGTASDDRSAFTVLDGRYLSARWPGDAYLFSRRFLGLLATSRS
jgi:putative intracellular protease/amidase